MRALCDELAQLGFSSVDIWSPDFFHREDDGKHSFDGRRGPEYDELGAKTFGQFRSFEKLLYEI